MPNDDLSRLTPATPDEVEFALSFALRYDGRRTFKHASESMSRIVAAHLARVVLLARRGAPQLHRPLSNVGYRSPPPHCAGGAWHVVAV